MISFETETIVRRTFQRSSRQLWKTITFPPPSTRSRRVGGPPLSDWVCFATGPWPGVPLAHGYFNSEDILACDEAGITVTLT